MPRSWSGPEIEFLSRHLGESTKDIVGLFNGEFEDRTYDSIQKKVKNLRDAISIVQHDQSSEITEGDFEEFREAVEPTAEPKLPHVTAADRRLARQDAEQWIRDVVTFSRDEISHIGGVIGSGEVESENTSLVVTLSDLHFGKITEYYNLEIARQRTRSIPSTLHRMVLPKIDEVVILLIGDIVEGEDIYATQNSKIECPVIDQTQAASQSIWEMVLLFRELFRCKVRVETVPGNHGRMSKTASEKSNWDNVIYYILDMFSRISDDPNIVVNVNYKQFNTCQIKGHNVGIYHKGVKHAGTPAMTSKIAGWVTTKQIDILCHGHWHEWHIGNWNGKLVVSNGCMCGPDDLAETMAKEDDGRQGYFLLSNDNPPHNFSYLQWSTKPQE